MGQARRCWQDTARASAGDVAQRYPSLLPVVSSKGRWRISPASGASFTKADPGRTDRKARSTPCTPATDGLAGQPGIAHASEVGREVQGLRVGGFTRPLLDRLAAGFHVSADAAGRGQHEPAGAAQVDFFLPASRARPPPGRPAGRSTSVYQVPALSSWQVDLHAALVRARRSRQLDLNRGRADAGLATHRLDTRTELPADDGLLLVKLYHGCARVHHDPTGASGRVGCHLARVQVRDASHRVHRLDRHLVAPVGLGSAEWRSSATMSHSK